MELTIKIDERFNEEPLTYLFEYFHLGKEKIKSLVLTVNEKVVTKNTIVKKDDILKVCYNDAIDFLPWNKPLKILYEDQNLLIVDKPMGMLVHPDSKDKNGTLVNIVANYYQKTNQNISVRYLHRIDVDTTGIVLFAKDILTASLFNYQISNHTLIRRYLCLCSGYFEENEGTYSYPIAEDRHQANKKRVSFKTGKEAVTHYHVLERLKHHLNLCLVQLETGRTHQIRLHFSYTGHPLVGDSLYNGNCNLMKRQALHSYETIFYHPFLKKELQIKSEIPSDMKEILKKYKK